MTTPDGRSLFPALRRNLPDVVFVVVCAVLLAAEFAVAVWGGR